jgi:hypothetical protein
MVEYGNYELLADSHNLKGKNFYQLQDVCDHLCGAVVSSWLQIRRSWFDSRHYHIF